MYEMNKLQVFQKKFRKKQKNWENKKRVLWALLRYYFTSSSDLSNSLQPLPSRPSPLSCSQQSSESGLRGYYLLVASNHPHDRGYHCC